MSSLDAFLGFAIFCIPGLGIMGFGFRQLRDVNWAWKQEVKKLQKQGLDPSNIKRNSEWEKTNNRNGIAIIVMGSLFVIMSISSLLVNTGVL